MKHNLNHHFIQKAFVKNFSNNEIVKWQKYKTNEHGEFNIDDFAKNQPIAIKNYYSVDLEIKIGDLENDGINIIKKIIKLIYQHRNKINLTRKELITLKYYFLLSIIRSTKIRNDIKNRNNSSSFNKIIDNEGKNEIEIQEKIMNLIMDSYIKCKKNDYKIEFENYSLEEIINIDNLNDFYNIKMFNIMQSRLNIIKFNSKKLLLTEICNFTEFNKTHPQSVKLYFFPIAPDIGLCFYFFPHIYKMNPELAEKSFIFQNNVHKYNNEQRYMNNINELHKNNLFIYDVLMENDDVQNFCNAMLLVHNENQILIYQNEEDILEAEKEIIDNKIYRVN
ncbi:MAG: hypothetical protein HDR43_00615 [Mycoplasma sp.]|nr:hypothetical protein [Mycoplasma sp.]